MASSRTATTKSAPVCVGSFARYGGGIVSTVGEIENALKALPVKDARAVAMWLQDYLDAQWDWQIEQDIATGKLDQLAERAQAHYRAGRTSFCDRTFAA